MKILVNGNFICFGDDKFDAIVFDEDIYFTGQTKEALKFDGEVIDLKGKTVIPGLIDISFDFLTVLYSKTFVDLSKAKNIEDVKLKLEYNMNNECIIGYNYNHLDNSITMNDIDYDIPIILINLKRNKALVNGAFMKKYDLSVDEIKGDKYKNIIKQIPGFDFTNSIQQASVIFYENGFVTQNAVIKNEIEKINIEKLNNSNIVLFDSINYPFDTRLLIDLSKRISLLELIDVLKDNITKQVFILVSTLKQVELLKDALNEIDCYDKKWNVLATFNLDMEDVIYFTRCGMYIGVDIDYEFIARKNLKYKPFEYLDSLDRNDINYSLFSSDINKGYNLIEKIKILTEPLKRDKEKYYYRINKLLRACTIYKATSLNIDNKLGNVKEGNEASFIVFNDNFYNSNDLEIEYVYKNGNIVYKKN